MESPAPTSYIKVDVAGTLLIPYDLELLQGLEDPVLEMEVLEESVRMAVSQRLGYFDRMDVQVDSVSKSLTQKSSPATMVRTCHAQLDLAALGGCIESMQKAYEHLLAHAKVLHEMLSAEGVSSTEEGTSAVTATEGPRSPPLTHEMLMVVERMLEQPGTVAEAAAAARPIPAEVGPADGGVTDRAGSPRTHSTPLPHSDSSDTDEYDYRRDDPEAAGYCALLNGSQSGRSDTSSEGSKWGDFPLEAGEAAVEVAIDSSVPS